MKGADARVLKLWERYKLDNDHDAKKALILEYAHLVKYTVGRMAVSLSPRAEINDLTNSGILGLIDAIEKFEIERAIKFETYAAIRIQGAILDHLRSLDWVPRTVRRKARTLEETYQALEHQFGRTPTEAEIAVHMGISLEELHKLLGDVSEIRDPTGKVVCKVRGFSFGFSLESLELCANKTLHLLFTRRPICEDARLAPFPHYIIFLLWHASILHHNLYLLPALFLHRHKNIRCRDQTDQDAVLICNRQVMELVLLQYL